MNHAPADPAMIGRLRRDVEALCVSPRHRDVPGSLEAARAYCQRRLEEVGWSVEERPFRPRPALRYSDVGHPTSPLAMRWLSGLEGVNLLAYGRGRGGPQAGDTLLIAHLDTVRSSVGADDNASGVAVALEVARQLADRDHQVVIALVDLEELMHLGARELAKTLPRPGLAVVLDAVGYFDDRPRSQRMPPGFGLMFPRVARELRNTERRGDFLLAVHRHSSEAFARAWAQAADSAGLPAVLLRDRRWDGRGQGFTRYLSPLLIDLDRSDHAPFWRRRIPAVFMTATATMRSPNYHRATDTPDTVDYVRLGRVAGSLTVAMTAEAARL